MSTPGQAVAGVMFLQGKRYHTSQVQSKRGCLTDSSSERPEWGQYLQLLAAKGWFRKSIIPSDHGPVKWTTVSWITELKSPSSPAYVSTPCKKHFFKSDCKIVIHSVPYRSPSVEWAESQHRNQDGG